MGDIAPRKLAGRSGATPLPRNGNGAGSRMLFGEGKPDLKAGVTRFGFNLDVAAVLFHDALHGVEAESGAFSHSLGGEEWLENVREHVRRNSGTVVGDFDHHGIVLAVDPQPEFAFAMHRVNGVVNDVGPDL